ncbi:bestrophin family protein [Marinigracilibium pacificum]|uniref:Uncharacterized protein n=1 Tax=Marinigracilibium pacificum TaxID=2729599 RepID=A0A848J067_9BACT|nr:bestrophin family ion channel [Marinigracilibium pacificum]NMM47940.1 hypothetical protein [Marinigracilibium pacificum]
MKSIKWQLLLVVVVIIITAFVGDILDRYTKIEHPIGIPAFFGTAIAFVLAFRTNQAYDRWWEARKIWGSIVNNSRSWFRMVLTLIKANSDKDKLICEKLIKRQVAWNYILSRRLRDNDSLDGIERYFEDSEFIQIRNSINPNQTILLMQSQDIRALTINHQIEDLHHIQLEDCLRSFEDSMAKAERIKNTHFPVLYDHLISVSIYLFASLLAFAIVDSSHVFEVIFSTIISGLFLTIEFVGTELQDPFEDKPSDTPMTAISNSIQRSAYQLLKLPLEPEETAQFDFYLK